MIWAAISGLFWANWRTDLRSSMDFSVFISMISAPFSPAAIASAAAMISGSSSGSSGSPFLRLRFFFLSFFLSFFLPFLSSSSSPAFSSFFFFFPPKSRLSSRNRMISRSRAPRAA